MRECLGCILCQKRLRLSRKVDECKPLPRALRAVPELHPVRSIRPAQTQRARRQTQRAQEAVHCAAAAAAVLCLWLLWLFYAPLFCVFCLRCCCSRRYSVCSRLDSRSRPLSFCCSRSMPRLKSFFACDLANTAGHCACVTTLMTFLPGLCMFGESVKNTRPEAQGRRNHNYHRRVIHRVVNPHLFQSNRPAL